MPNGKIVSDFSVTTLADVAMIVPVTRDGKVVMVNQFKPGFDDVILELPAGRTEPGHNDLRETAIHELHEETGIVADNLEYIGIVAGFVTKGTEKVSCYVAADVAISSTQKLDENKDIEVVLLTPHEIVTLISKNKIQAAITIAAWVLAKYKYPELFQQ